MSATPRTSAVWTPMVLPTTTPRRTLMGSCRASVLRQIKGKVKAPVFTGAMNYERTFKIKR